MTRAILRGAAAVCLLAALVAIGWVTNASAAIYWQSSSQFIGRANLDGSNADPEFITLPTIPGATSVTICGGVAVDGEHIYWADNELDTIGRANLDGSGVNRFFIAGANSPCGIAVDSSHIYWANFEDEFIGRARIDGTGVEPQYMDAGFRTCGVAGSGADLFWTLNSSIGRANAGGIESPASYLPNVEAGCGLAVDDDHLYWTESGDEGSIGRATIDSKVVDRKLISGLLRPCAVAVHDGAIYWSEQMAPANGPFGSIGRARVDGSDARHNIVTGIRNLCGIAVDDVLAPPLPGPLVSGQLSVGPIRHNRRAGTVVVALDLTARGALDIRVPRAIKARLLGGGTEVEAGRRWLKLSVGPGSANAWPRAALRRKGRVQFTLAIGYRPENGRSSLKAKRVSLVRVPANRPKAKRIGIRD